ncbi:MAG: hypothetical protein SF339_22115 [Blastocatellia bacterium]|nr:hypothetical protein [Blastocatellia bacterium]
MTLSAWLGWHLPFAASGLAAWRLARGREPKRSLARLGAALLIAAGLAPERFLPGLLLAGWGLVAAIGLPRVARARREERSFAATLFALHLVVTLSLLRVAGIPDRPPRLACAMLAANAIAQAGFVFAARKLDAQAE